MSDLISRQAILAIAMDSCLDLDKWDDTDLFCKEIEDLPSADIMECARAIKEYCKDKRYCDGCIFDNGKSFSCRLQPIPTDWDLPEGKKGEEDAKET